MVITEWVRVVLEVVELPAVGTYVTIEPPRTAPRSWRWLSTRFGCVRRSYSVGALYGVTCCNHGAMCCAAGEYIYTREYLRHVCSA